MLKIERELVEFLCTAAKNTHPDEFASFLREKNGIITEAILSPISFFGKRGSIIDWRSLPFDRNIKGTIHSHPIPNNTPSSSDLRFFSKFGRYHGILAFPYTEEMLVFYSRTGSILRHEVLF
jgi:proteasome lid subunit RPN8/RPN11